MINQNNFSQKPRAFLLLLKMFSFIFVNLLCHIEIVQVIIIFQLLNLLCSFLKMFIKIDEKKLIFLDKVNMFLYQYMNKWKIKKTI